MATQAPVRFFTTSVITVCHSLKIQGHRPNADLFAFDLQEEIPDFPVPLRGEMPEPIVSLQTILNQTYQRGRLDLLIDYTIDPIPGLKEHDRLWMQAILA